MSYTEQLAKVLQTSPERVQFTAPALGLFNINFLNPYGKAENIASFSMKEAPGCCGLIFSFHSNVTQMYRGRGIGTILNQMRQKIAYELGYSAIICTDIESNESQLRILKSQDWAKVFAFVNRRTSNEVGVHMKALSADATPFGQYFVGSGATGARPK